MGKRVAVIGAGPCGLGQLRAFAAAKEKGADIPEIVCYEKQDDWGGLWNMTWRTGIDQYGEPVHGSMYRYLWSNGPKECLEFGDYSFEEHFGKPIPSFPPREVLADYIVGRAEKSGVKDWVRFATVVRSISHDPGSNKFSIRATDLNKQEDTVDEFDHVIVSTGHFSVPKVPHIKGIEKFPGRVIHSHDFREAREFKGLRVLVLGASYSAEDIALQIHKYGAKQVTTSYRTAAMGFEWPEGIEEIGHLQELDDNVARFKDGTTREIDALIMCTGYLHHFPFLGDDLKLKTHNRLYPPGIYKGVFWQDNPNLMYLGMQDQYYTFSMFDAQAWYARDYILGRIELPSAADREKDISEWVAREEKLETPFDGIDFQADYLRDLCAATDYPKFDIDLTVKEFYEWEHDKEESILGYRNKSFESPCTGTMAPVHHTPWIEAMDDSMATFLDTKS